VGIVQKKQKGKSGKRKGQVRYVSREEPKPSFFHFFGEPDEDEMVVHMLLLSLFSVCVSCFYVR
jgi:hypothetical protein